VPNYGLQVVSETMRSAPLRRRAAEFF